jgi:hypothetical protein
VDEIGERYTRKKIGLDVSTGEGHGKRDGQQFKVADFWLYIMLDQHRNIALASHFYHP